MRPDGKGWCCFRCGGKGDVVTLASLVATGERLDRTNAPRVREWLEARGQAAPAPLATRRAPDLPPSRPPRADVHVLWERARPVVEDVDVCGWLRSRGLEPATVEERDLARALPTERLPRWARSRTGTWWESGHRLLFPLFGPTGALTSVRARAVLTPAEPAKALSPQGFSVAGLVLADALARRMLEGARLGDRTPAHELVRVLGVVVTEGEPDFLTWATRASDASETAPAVLGLVAGSWTDEIATRVPDGARVALRTHEDEAGEVYARRVAETLRGRCVLVRPRRGGTS
jgi:hypothetical protein